MKTPNELQRLITNRLAAAYSINPSEIATLCDEQIDKSGNLLGWLRDYIRYKVVDDAEESSSKVSR